MISLKQTPTRSVANYLIHEMLAAIDERQNMTYNQEFFEKNIKKTYPMYEKPAMPGRPLFRTGVSSCCFQLYSVVEFSPPERKIKHNVE